MNMPLCYYDTLMMIFGQEIQSTQLHVFTGYSHPGRLQEILTQRRQVKEKLHIVICLGFGSKLQCRTLGHLAGLCGEVL